MSDFSTPEIRPAAPPDDDWRIYRGESMLRVFVPGDLLHVEKIVAAQAELGDIIAFDTPRGGVTVHRAIARKPGGELVTMGDNNPRPDFSAVKPEATVFRVVEVRRGDGRSETVSGGKDGMAEFRRNRRNRWFRSELPRYASGVCRRLWPFKRRLNAPVRFGGEEVFYVRCKPVAKRSADGRVRWASPWYRVIYRIG
ncbi:MAG: S24/S26 family peptidase [Lentisphaeria bacterium]|nr:S24/S26 family peptidase [Lentisphaeria bacterium]